MVSERTLGDVGLRVNTCFVRTPSWRRECKTWESTPWLAEKEAHNVTHNNKGITNSGKKATQSWSLLTAQTHCKFLLKFLCTVLNITS